MDMDKNVEGRFERLDEKVDRNSRKIDENARKLDRHDDLLAFIIKKMDENQEEIRRLFGVKDEQHSSDLKGLGEGVRSNRERLDDHEGRLEDLEAS